MSKKISSGISVVAIVFLVIMIGGIFWLQRKKVESPAVEPVAVRPATPVVQTANWQKYTNAKYGFELTFPGTWQGYETSDRTVDFVDINTTDAIDFILNEKSLFVIVIIPKNEWNKINNKDLTTYLGGNDQYVFTYYINQEPEPDVIDRLSEIGDIGKTFKFVK